ncbi:hypothetical protein DM806_07250 [Sphingobium lactosutens]|uniref:hypothetical protein n=1 Tax=Sphingobium lactosutens TaxID=522773 RepID=UPI0015B924CE|nr:hypothetical protein [Sphingobium lactosutens]NWK95467.1 hypothetical protein [Sphingobium lactosutens]
MSDIGLVFISGLAITALSVLCSHWIVALRPRWSSRRIALLSALPLPLLACLLAAFVFLRAAMASKQDCGVDACGMAMAGSMMLGLTALILYLVAFAIVYLIVQGYRK